MSGMGAGSVDVRTAGGKARSWPSCGLSATLQPWPGRNLLGALSRWTLEPRLPAPSSQALEASCPGQCRDPPLHTHVTGY